MNTIVKAIIATLVMIGMIPVTEAAFVDVKLIQICDDAGISCAIDRFFETETDKIWGQAGIDMNFLSLSTVNRSDWLDVDFDSNPADNLLDDEILDVMSYGRERINNSYETLAINLFFVDSIDHSAGFYGLGCGAPIFAGLCHDEVGVFIAGSVYSFNRGIGRIDTIAHEIGHVLGLTHDGFGAGGGNNLMSPGFSRVVPSSVDDIYPDGATLSRLTDEQITEVFNSGFVQTIPEPSPIILILFTLAPILFRPLIHFNV